MVFETNYVTTETDLKSLISINSAIIFLSPISVVPPSRECITQLCEVFPASGLSLSKVSELWEDDPEEDFLAVPFVAIVVDALGSSSEEDAIDIAIEKLRDTDVTKFFDVEAWIGGELVEWLDAAMEGAETTDGSQKPH